MAEITQPAMLPARASGKPRTVGCQSQATRLRAFAGYTLLLSWLMQVQIQYANAITCNQTDNAYSPWEGLEIKFYGTEGELNHRHVEVHGVFAGERNRAVDDNVTTELHLFGQHPESLRVWEGKGVHGGGGPDHAGLSLCARYDARGPRGRRLVDTDRDCCEPFDRDGAID